MDNKLIYSKVANIMRQTKAIAKSSKNQQQGFLFRGIDDVMNELHNSFADNDVFVIPEVTDFQVSEKVTGKGGILYYTRATIKHHFTTTDGSEIVTTTVGEAMDSGDKGMNKAMSIALKYALMQLLLIPTKEDKDPDASTPPVTRPKTIREVISSLNPDTHLDLINALDEVDRATNKDELTDVYKRNLALYKSESVFKECLSAKRKELGV